MKDSGNVLRTTLCRSCKSTFPKRIISLGPHPNVNSYIKKESFEKEEYYYPFDVYLCNKCGFLQLGHEINPKILFDDYVYVSSASPIFVSHSIDYAKRISERFALDSLSCYHCA